MNNQAPHKDHRKRMREKFARSGLSAFPDHEILEMLLFNTVPRRNTNEMGHGLLEKFGSLSGVFSASKQELCEVDGIGETSADYIVFLGDIYREITSELFSVTPITTDDAAGMYATLLMMQSRNESSAAVYLRDDGTRICDKWFNVGKEKMTDGIVDGIIAEAKAVRATDIIIAHNHKGEPLEPSPDDLVLTEKLKIEAADAGINSLRHVIVSEDGYIFI